MTWKEKKELENKKVVSLGGKVKKVTPLLNLPSVKFFVASNNCIFPLAQASQEAETTP